MPGGHFGAENGEILAPAADFSGVERGGRLGLSVMSGQEQKDSRYNGRVCRESEKAQENLRSM